jgi:hypothetical protein
MRVHQSRVTHSDNHLYIVQASEKLSLNHRSWSHPCRFSLGKKKESSHSKRHKKKASHQNRTVFGAEVFLQRGLLREPSLAKLADKRLLPGVRANVVPQVRGNDRGVVAVAAKENGSVLRGREALPNAARALHPQRNRLLQEV